MKMVRLIGLVLLIFIVITVATADDAELNYIRGTVFMPDGKTPAPSGTVMTIKVTSGMNEDYKYVFSVDDDGIPEVIYSRGFYNSKDNINFDTNATFEVTATTGLMFASATGKFVMGGNGRWGGDEINLTLQPTPLSFVLLALIMTIVILVIVYTLKNKRRKIK
jgi:uncharacterized integral membrane protein